ncbi:hypothetical protein JANAI62_23510 [Jannaschia pagri]|uniref:Uncharacterized protein n=1 Tax=Jannaschia pagri TaxID=2829797 RepID=A0ABQ4NMV1_9RHOB|nr:MULTISPECIES: hypothetical protein [unclassified Jannaschia]GIT91894.1 hypothetical protein JANAI61_23520 [Jannaschia sp. AI_61]GIT95728.1 hypothetical protein JANAI62_23510 [Jannaschia sp. AI_62]
MKNTVLAPCVVTLALLTPSVGLAERHGVHLEAQDGARITIGTLDLAPDGAYTLALDDGKFSDNFLSMRPFQCLDGPDKQWCYVPYPYENARVLGDDLTDLEYDLLFVWKGVNDYGINMWNGVYYRLQPEGDRIVGTLHEMDMDRLAVPPAPGQLRPIRPVDLEVGDPDSHWLPRVVIE